MTSCGRLPGKAVPVDVRDALISTSASALLMRELMRRVAPTSALVNGCHIGRGGTS